ncbi:hypothetical protein NE237_018954 [Protea cynaroides]|uniref:Longin domain-containing protein n=1 Tax=Protea cynaroides TaxID=273540 RepID=A0A9Q0QPE8_9MAGN|nr:hypothetical protein NE237_018954 [Protea cynaroides]
MGSIQNMVFYCCVAKGNRILYAYSCGDPEIDKLAVLCLERAPPFHTWYFQSVGKRTYGFLMEDGYVYFSIVDESLRKSGALQFLEHVRDEFKKVAKSSSRDSISGLNSVCLQEQLVPVVRRLINSLEQVSQSQSDGSWRPEIPLSQHPGPSPSPDCGQTEVATSTKAPLLGQSSKQVKKKMKDRVIEVRDNCYEEHRRSTDREIKDDGSTSESDNQGMGVSSMSVQKGSSSMRVTRDPQHVRRIWRRQVLIVIAIDLLVVSNEGDITSRTSCLNSASSQVIEWFITYRRFAPRLWLSKARDVIALSIPLLCPWLVTILSYGEWCSIDIICNRALAIGSHGIALIMLASFV